MSAQLTSADLQFTYSRKATPGDNPGLRGLDSNLFNGHEEYEVLSFINGFLRNHTVGDNPMTKEHGLKIERILRQKPGNIRSKDRVTEWIKTNWSSIS